MTEARAQGAMLGLALGDAYARPLRLLTDQTVRVCPVSLSTLQGTDDLDQVLFISKAILDTSPDAFDEQALGHAVARRFVEWSHTAKDPDGATLRGAAAYTDSGEWRAGGDASGCIPALRALPVSLAFRGEELTAAARVQALFSHGNPEAVDAAVAAGWLVRFIIESGSVDPYAVRRVIAGLNGGWAQEDAVANALQTALRVAERPRVHWLDDPEPDRASSALGTAVAAALIWRDDPATCMDRAARVPNGPGIAALAGMLVGAAAGPQGLPQAWVQGLPNRDELCAQATSLVQWSEVRRSPDLSFDETDSDELDVAQQLVASLHLAGARFVPDRDASTGRTAIKVQQDHAAHVQMLEHLAGLMELQVLRGARYLTLLVPGDLAPLGDGRTASTDHPAARTSQTDPIRVAWLEANLRGRIGLTFAPGKTSRSHFGPPWDRDLDADLERLAGVHHVRLLVPLIEDHELLTLRIPALQQRAEDFGVAVTRLPIPDGGVPPRLETRAVVDLALSVARAGYNVCFHCRGGLGRAGTLAACTLVRLGLDAEVAMAHVRDVRPGAIENALQERFIREFQVEVAGR